MQFPSCRATSGKGASVASVAIVDGGDFSETDLTLYLQHERIGSLSGDVAPRPVARHVLLPGAARSTTTGPTAGDSFEADLDAQQVAMTAPGATLSIFVLGDDTDGSFPDADTQIVESNNYDVVSTSYGECEIQYTAAYDNDVDESGVSRTYNDLYKQGNSQGITWTYASGDDGALDCPEIGYFINAPTNPPTVYRGVLSADANASLPTVIGVGGGELTRTRTDTSTIVIPVKI